MKKSIFLGLLCAVVGLPVWGAEIFIPHRGQYPFSGNDVIANLQDRDLSYLRIRDLNDPKHAQNFYRFDKKKNEYRIENWFQKDWYSLQDMWVLDIDEFNDKYQASSFNEAKRKQYQGFKFNKKKFYHYKTIPSLKEWGGLTHPPIKKVRGPLEKIDSNFKSIDYQQIESAYFDVALQKEIDDLSRSELSFGNEVRAFADQDAFRKKLELIDRAKESLLVSSLAFACDESSRQVALRLIDKHREGVLVKVIVDKMISKLLGMTECIYLMRRNGVEVVETVDFFKHEGKAIYHSKVLVMDFKEAVTGGLNMHDAGNLSKGTDFKNRDVDLYVKGELVIDIAKQFVENWNYQAQFIKGIKPLLSWEEKIKTRLAKGRQEKRRGPEQYQSILSTPALRMKGVCRFIKQSPYEDRHTIGKAYLKLLDHVEKHLIITNPIKNDTYVSHPLKASFGTRLDDFTMFNLLFKKVQQVARTGKKIDYITTSIDMAGNELVDEMNQAIAEQLDNAQKWRANWSYFLLRMGNRYFGKPHYKNLMKDWLPFQNMHIWTNISFLHSKIFYFDRVLSSVGSYNFHHNATDQAYESTILCMDENLNRDLDQILVQDMANSIPLIFKK